MRCGRREPRRGNRRAAGRSSSVPSPWRWNSGCHCTAAMNEPPGRRIASIMPSVGHVASTTKPGARSLIRLVVDAVDDRRARALEDLGQARAGDELDAVQVAVVDLGVAMHARRPVAACRCPAAACRRRRRSSAAGRGRRRARACRARRKPRAGRARSRRGCGRRSTAARSASRRSSSARRRSRPRGRARRASRRSRRARRRPSACRPRGSGSSPRSRRSTSPSGRSTARRTAASCR